MLHMRHRIVANILIVHYFILKTEPLSISKSLVTKVLLCDSVYPHLQCGCFEYQHLQCAYIIQLNLHKRRLKCINSKRFYFSASQMLIFNPSRCKREGTGARYIIFSLQPNFLIIFPIRHIKQRKIEHSI